MKKVKLSFAILFAILTISNSVSAQKWWGSGITGEGETIKKELDVDNFQGISLQFSGDVIITQGSTFKVVAEGQENIIDNIETDVNGKIWEIEFHNSVRNHKGVNIYITMPVLTKAYISGSGDISTTNHFPEVEEFHAGVSGSGDLRLDVDAHELTSKISGSGNIDIKGKAENLEVRISGSGDVDAYELDAEHVEISIAGSGDCKVAANQSLDIRVAGSGDVYYKGNPSKLKSSVTGSGDVTSRN